MDIDTHLRNTLMAMNSLLQSESHVDAFIYCENQVIKAHKVMLAASCGFFQRVLDVVSHEHFRIPVVALAKVRMSQMRRILDFIYTGDAVVPQNELDEFMETVELLEVHGLRGDVSNADADSQETESCEVKPNYGPVSVNVTGKQSVLVRGNGSPAQHSPQRTQSTKQKTHKRKEAQPVEEGSPKIPKLIITKGTSDGSPPTAALRPVSATIDGDIVSLYFV
jgi:hypothetical protein